MRRPLLALTATLLGGGLLAPGAQAAPALGIPANTPTLFALNADAGTLTPVAGKRGRFVLTLSKLDRRGVWFTDKPARQSGSVRPAALFSSWKALGFAADPPNAVLTLFDGRAQADTAALELGTPRYSARTGTVRFNAKALSSLSGGLARHGTKVDAKLPRRFGNAALFIDDGQDDGQIGSGGGCSIGEVALLAREDWIPPGLLLAKGLALPIDENDPLYSLYFATFGTAPAGQFRIPNLTAPAGMTYVICHYGDFPFGPSAANDCATNEINAFPSVPGSNWTVRRDIAPLAPGLTWWQCNGGPPGDSPPLCTIGQVTLFGGGAVGPGYLPADGRILSISTNALVYQTVGNAFGGDAMTTFGLPNLPGPVAGTTYGVCATGIYPTFPYG